MFINHTSKEVTAKIVYYGPGLSGKTSNLQYIFSVTNDDSRGKLVSIETDIERTLFFDLLPINVGLIKGYKTRFQLYTVPGQVFYNTTRKLVLKGVDGLVFVADSHPYRMEANVASLEDLRAMWTSLGQGDLAEAPLVFQYNKRDLPGRLPLEELEARVNVFGAPFVPAIAIDGKGVSATLKQITRLAVHRALSTKYTAAGGDAAAASAS